jgi:hypothetical protein
LRKVADVGRPFNIVHAWWLFVCSLKIYGRYFDRCFLVEKNVDYNGTLFLRERNNFILKIRNLDSVQQDFK